EKLKSGGAFGGGSARSVVSLEFGRQICRGRAVAPCFCLQFGCTPGQLFFARSEPSRLSRRHRSVAESAPDADHKRPCPSPAVLLRRHFGADRRAVPVASRCGTVVQRVVLEFPGSS